MSLNFKSIHNDVIVECIGSNSASRAILKSTCKIPFGIILPSMYYIKIQALPVSSEQKAKKLASAVFEGLLPKNKQFKYIAKKTQNAKFCLIAYCEDDIFEKIKQSGSNAFLWFFAQFAITQNLQLQNDALILQDDILLELPKNLITSSLHKSTPINCDFLKSIFYFQKPKDTLQYILSASLVTLIICFLAQSFIYAKSGIQALSLSSEISKNTTENIDDLDAKILQLQTIQNKQYAIRNSFDIFAQTKNIAKLESMKYENSKLEAVFTTQNSSKFKAITSGFNTRALVISGNTISLQIVVGEQ